MNWALAAAESASRMLTARGIHSSLDVFMAKPSFQQPIVAMRAFVRIRSHKLENRGTIPDWRMT